MLLPTLLTANAHAASGGLTSPFPSAVRGVSIPNAHELTPRVLRGSAPIGRVAELQAAGVREVLIFKEATSGEVKEEVAELKAAGFTKRQIHEVPFRWRNFKSPAVACQQTLKGLKLLLEAEAGERGKTFFHCTVGEDRTGYLAGLFRMVVRGDTRGAAFERELCENGYEAGNPQKPDVVVQAIRGELTPLFLAMSAKIQDGSITEKTLLSGKVPRSVCADLVLEKAKTPVCRNSPLAR